MMSNKITILYIDDEAHNLNSFKASYRREWQIYTAENAAKALEIIKENEISVVLSDHLMPGKTGVELLEEIASLYPDISRILITAHAETHLIQSAVNRGRIHYFLEKPWNNETLKQAIISCYKIYLTQKELKEKNILLARANEELSRFVYSASHEMRAPLMSILGLVKLSESEDDLKELHHYFELINESALQLDGYILSIIEYYKNKNIETVFKEIDLNQVFAEIKKEYLKNIDISIHLNIIQNSPLYSDPHRLKIALGNLVTSAIAYHKEPVDLKELTMEFVISENKLEFSVGLIANGVLFDFVNQVFKKFFSEIDTKQSAESFLMNSFLFKEALQMLKGNIVEIPTETTTDSFYKITIPNQYLS